MFKNLLTKSLLWLGTLALIFIATAPLAEAATQQVSFDASIGNLMTGESIDCSPCPSSSPSSNCNTLPGIASSFRTACIFKYNPNRTAPADLNINYSFPGLDLSSSSNNILDWWIAEYWYTGYTKDDVGARYIGNNYSLHQSPRAPLSVPSGTISVSRPVNNQASGHLRTHWDFSFHHNKSPQLIKIWAVPNTDIPLNFTTINSTNLWLAWSGAEFIPLPNNSAPLNWPVIGEASVTSNQTPTCQVKYQSVTQDSFSPTSNDYASRYAFFNLQTTGSHSYDLSCDAGSATLSPAYTATGLPQSTDIHVAVQKNESNNNKKIPLNVGASLTTAITHSVQGNGVANFLSTNWDIYNFFFPAGFKLVGDSTSYAQIAGFHCATAGRDACWAVLSRWMGPQNADQWVDTFMVTDQADDNWVIENQTPRAFLKSLSLSQVGSSATYKTLAVCPNQSVTVSWAGENLPATCTTASSPSLTGWNGNLVASNQSIGSYTLSSPALAGDYHLGLSCGTNIEAQIKQLATELKSPQLTVLPATHPSCFTLTPTESGNPISGLVTDGSGNPISGVTVSVNNGTWTAVSGSNGAWSIPASTHRLVKGGSFSASVVLPTGYQSAVAKNARTTASSYQWQIIDTNCADNSASPSCRDLIGTWLKDASLLNQTVLNGQIHDLAPDNTYDFVLNREPSLSASCSASPFTLDTGDSSTLSASVSGGSGNYTYDWSYSPDSGTSSLNVSYNTAGQKVELVTVRDTSLGLSTTASCVLNVVNPSQPAPQPATPPACSDSLDNDADGLIDSADPGCLASGYYDPNDNDETDPPVTPVIPVIPGDDNPDGTEGGTNDNIPNITINQNPAVNITYFYASPSSVPTNNLNTTLYWNVKNATYCEVNNYPSNQPKGVIVDPNGQTFHLTCMGAGAPDSVSLDVTTYQPSISCSVNNNISLTKNILKGGMVNVANFFSCSMAKNITTTVTGPNNKNITITNDKISPVVSGQYRVKVVPEDGFIITGDDTINLQINVFTPDVEETN